MYQNGGKYAKLSQNIPNAHKSISNGRKKQMSIKYTLQRPSKIYQNCEFWSENIPSGNPVVDKGL
jgi:hypothetical protein